MLSELYLNEALKETSKQSWCGLQGVGVPGICSESYMNLHEAMDETQLMFPPLSTSPSLLFPPLQVSEA